MTRLSAPNPTRRRRQQAISLLAIFSLLMGALMPLAQATASPAGANTLLAAICSPDGIRYVEMDLGAPEETPSEPLPAAMEHCPGCLSGTGPALLPTLAEFAPLDTATPVAPIPAGLSNTCEANAGFRPRAPPAAN